MALQALKLYYRVTCPCDWPILKLARVKVHIHRGNGAKDRMIPLTVTLNLTYTLMVGAQPTAIKKPAARCTECGGELECLGVGQYAILKLRLRAHAQTIDIS